MLLGRGGVGSEIWVDLELSDSQKLVSVLEVMGPRRKFCDRCLGHPFLFFLETTLFSRGNAATFDG